MNVDADIDKLGLENQCDIPLFMLMVLTVSTNHIRKELCHCAVIGIMQIFPRQGFVITTLIHKFPFFIISTLRHELFFFIIYVVFIIFCHRLMLLLLCRLVNRRTWKKNKCILLNNEQENKVNSQRSFSCISVDFSGEAQQALFLSLPIRSTPSLQ